MGAEAHLINHLDVAEGSGAYRRLESDREVRLYLTHVHCAECVRDLIEGVVSKIEGVKEARFEESDLSLLVRGDVRMNDDELKNAVKAVGYEFRDAGTGVERTSSLANALYVLTAVGILGFLIYMLQRV